MAHIVDFVAMPSPLNGTAKYDDPDLDIDSDDLIDQKKKLENSRYKSDSGHRVKLTVWTKYVVSIWLGLVILVITLNHHIFFLSDAVLIALICTTTLNVLGLAYIVLKGYFHVMGESAKNG